MAGIPVETVMLKVVAVCYEWKRRICSKHIPYICKLNL